MFSSIDFVVLSHIDIYVPLDLIFLIYGLRYTCEVCFLPAFDQIARDQIANIHWITEKAREFQKNIYFCFIDFAKAFDCVDHNKLWKILRDGNTRPPYLPPEKLVCRIRSNT